MVSGPGVHIKGVLWVELKHFKVLFSDIWQNYNFNITFKTNPVCKYILTYIGWINKKGLERFWSRASKSKPKWSLDQGWHLRIKIERFWCLPWYLTSFFSKTTNRASRASPQFGGSLYEPPTFWEDPYLEPLHFFRGTPPLFDTFCHPCYIVSVVGL